MKSLDVHVLYLKIQGEMWHRFFFDCGTLFWREVDAPDIWQTTPNDEFHYPQGEIGAELGVIETVTLLEEQDVSEIHLKFLNGTFLLLRHVSSQDTMRLLVTPNGILDVSSS